MKKTISILCIALAVIMMAATLASCGGASMNGTYKLTKGSVDGEEYDTESFLLLMGLEEGTSITLTVQDTSATLSRGDEDIKLTVDTDAMTMADEYNDTRSFTFSGNTITLLQDSMTAIFEKE